MDNLKVKNKDIQFKSCITQVKDIDEKGKVVFYASVFGTPDKTGEIVDFGAYKKTITEQFREIQHYKNHNPELMPGVLYELTEEQYGLKSVSQLILNTQLGRETYEEYKAMAAAGKSMGHSIGYINVRQPEKESDNFIHLKEIALREVSTLTKRAAHSDALTVSIKSFDELDFEELVKEEIFYKNLLNCKFTDAKLENLELIKNHISALIDESRRKLAPGLNDAPLLKSDFAVIIDNELFTNKF